MAATRRSGFRTAMKIAAAVLLVVPTVALLALAAVLLYARTDAGRERVRQLVLSQARRSVPGLELRRIGGDYVSDLILEGIVVRDREQRPAVQVERVTARFRLLPLLGKRLFVREVVVESPRVLGRPTEDETLNLTELTAPPEKQQPPAAEPKQKKSGGLAIHLGRLVVTDARADVEMPDGRRVLVSRLELEGAADVDGAEITGRLARLDLDASVDERALSVALAARGDIDENQIHAAIDRLVVRGLAPDDPVSFTGAVNGPRDALALKLDGQLGGGTLALRGKIGLLEKGLGEWNVDLRADGIDPARVAVEAPPGKVGVHVTGSGTGTPLAPASRSSLTVTVPPSRVRDLSLRTATIEASTDEARWQVTRAHVRGLGAELNATAEGEGAALAADLNATVGDPSDGKAPIEFRGRGRLVASVKGRAPDDLDFDVKATGRRLGVADATIGFLDLTARGSAEKESIAADVKGVIRQIRSGTARVQLVQLSARAAGSPEAPRGTVGVVVRGLHPSPDGPRIDRARLQLASDGRNVTLQATGMGPHADGWLQARGQVSPRRADVRIERLSVDVHHPKLRQAIALVRPFELRFRADDLVSVSEIALRGRGQQFTGNAAVSGLYRLDRRGRNEPRAQVRLSFEGATLAELDKFDGDAAVTLGRRAASGELTLTAGKARLEARTELPLRPSLGTPRLARRGPVALTVATKNVRLEELPLLQKKLARQGLAGGTFDLQAKVSGDLRHPDARVTFDLRDVELRQIAGVGRDSVVRKLAGVGGSIQIDTTPGVIRLQGRALLKQMGIVDADVRVRKDLGDLIGGDDITEAPMSVKVNVPGFQLASLKEFAERLRDTEGVLKGSAAFTGTLKRPVGRADLAVDGLRVETMRFGKVALHGDTDGSKVNATVDIRQQQGGALDLRAAVDRPRQTIAATVAARKLDPGFARLFTAAVRELGGTVDANLRLAGPLAAPAVTGNAYFYGGRVGVVGQPTFQGVGVSIEAKPGRVDVPKAEVYSGGGSFKGKGWATVDGLRPTSMVFTARADDFVVAAAGASGAKLNGDFAMEAAMRADVLAGKVRVPKADVWLEKLGGGKKRKLQKIGQHDDVRFVDEAARAAAERARKTEAQRPKDAQRLALQATAGTVWVRGKELDIELESNLKITGEGGKDPQVNGTVSIRRGRIEIQKQRFDFEQGLISFAGPPVPELNIRIARQYPEAMVRVEVLGTPEKPRLRLTSEPPVFDQAQIVSLLLTGQASGAPSTGGSFDPTAAVATMVLGKLADEIAPELGLDVLRVENVKQKDVSGESTGETDMRVEVGKYVSERIYVSYAHVFGAAETQNRNEAHVEYRVTRRWLVETIFGDAGVGGVDAFWVYRY